MSIRTWSDGILLLSGVVLTFATPWRAEAQDVDVPGNLTMHDSVDPTVGNILKEGVPFLHNFGFNNTFVGSNAGNLTMNGGNNTAIGVNALFNNTTGTINTASGAFALQSNTTGTLNTANGFAALFHNTDGVSNTAIGLGTLNGNTTGNQNTAGGAFALSNNSEGGSNTAFGFGALSNNTIGTANSALGQGANVSQGDLFNATAIGAGAVVDASNKVRFGNSAVTVIEGQVPYTFTSDRNKKENFRAVDAQAVLAKLRGLSVTSWNYKGQDAKQFRHYGPVAQDFFAAFGHDAVGTIGTPTSITSGDFDGILMIAAQALEKRTVEQEKEIAQLKARLEALERRLGTKVAGR
jgi:hypothetical protein